MTSGVRGKMASVAMLSVVLAGFLVLSRIGGWRAAVSGLALASLLVLPGRNLFGIPVTTTAIILGAVIGVIVSVNVKLPLRFAPFFIYSAVLVSLHWGNTQTQQDRLGELLLSVCAFVVGSFIADTVRRSVRAERAVVLVLLLAIVIQVAVSVLQAAGFAIFVPTGDDAELMGGRTSGTFSHPGNLGKALFLSMFLLFPMTRSADRFVARSAMIATLLCFIPVGLSASRANLVALVALALAWVVLLPRTTSLRARIVLPITVAIVGLVFLETILERFLSDPDGGARPRLMAVALQHIPENLWLGVGPETYIEYFGKYDLITANGWPVHNVFVLQLAELGLFGALLLFLPLLILPLLRAIKLRKDEGRAGMHARVLIAAVPGLLIIGTTGWSLTSGSIGMVLFLAMGYLAGQFRPASPTDEVLAVPVTFEVGSRPGRPKGLAVGRAS